MNYKLLDKAVNFYEQKGFKYIEVPWWVPEEIMDITRPPTKTCKDDYYLPINHKYLVASGEQSFIYLSLKEQLPEGKYQTITPCFRNESIGALHRKHFMKNELFCINTFFQIEEDSLDFFEILFGLNNLRINPLDKNQVDIEVNVDKQWTEIGSYGFREYGPIKWSYGTGCAEPRTSSLMKIIENTK
jgi:phenylalanyl-tRNA synthetase alpha subunit